MRKYQPIWNQIKEHNEASLSAPTEIHQRIIQAVRKERSRDVGWKYLLWENQQEYMLKVEIVGTFLRFYLLDKSL